MKYSRVSAAGATEFLLAGGKRMAENRKKQTNVQPKPYLRGRISDGLFFRNALGFFGTITVLIFVSFLICSFTGFNNTFLRILLNILIIGAALYVVFSRGVSKGTEVVSRSENYYNRKSKGLEITENETALCFHPLKGLLYALAGSALFIIPAVILAVFTEKQVTGYGVLPQWMDSYLRRTEIGGPLAAYVTREGLSFIDILRVIVRISIMPAVSMTGAENSHAILVLERISPVLLCLPAAAYGFGYSRGPAERAKVHAEIAENAKKSRRREKTERKRRTANREARAPQQLN